MNREVQELRSTRNMWRCRIFPAASQVDLASEIRLSPRHGICCAACFTRKISTVPASSSTR